MRRATYRLTAGGMVDAISIHALHEESDPAPTAESEEWTISIHALHEESDMRCTSVLLRVTSFQSTLSMRRATYTSCGIVFHIRFQSTLSMRRATGYRPDDNPGVTISIHALHEESDYNRSMDILDTTLFQSTLSMRRATTRKHVKARQAAISIHALHEESDQLQDCMPLLRYHHFNPRSP